jgi:hypothetical protein
MAISYAIFSTLLTNTINAAYYAVNSAYPDAINLTKIREYFLGLASISGYLPSLITYTEVYNYINDTYTAIDVDDTTTTNITNQYVQEDDYATANYNYDMTVVDIKSLTDYNPMNIGNGKLCITSKNTYNEMTKVYITTRYETNDTDEYNKNITETFNNQKYHLYSYNNTSLKINDYTEKIGMYNGKFTKTYNYTRTNTVNGSVEFTYYVTESTFALRQYPFCTLKKFTIYADPTTSGTPDPFIFLHEVETPATIQDYVYSNDIVNNTYGLQYSFFNVEGYKENIKGKKKKFVCQNTYISSGGITTLGGYEQRKVNTRIGYNKFTINFTDITDIGNYTHAVEFYILGGHMSQYDFPKPVVECKKMLTNILNNIAVPYIKINVYDDGESTLTEPFSILGYYPLYTTYETALTHNSTTHDTYHTLIYDIKEATMTVTDVDFEAYDNKKQIILYRPSGLTEETSEVSSVVGTKYYDGTYVISSTPVTSIDTSALQTSTTPSASTSAYFAAFTDKIITQHTLLWGDLWDSLIEIKQDSGNTSAQKRQLNNLNRIIKLHLYNLYCLIRSDIKVDFNPLNLSITDLDGSLYWIAELWVMPTLIMLHPKIAKNLLDFRYSQLEKAKAVAESRGLSGTQFPYTDNEISYNDAYANAESAVYVFNTALVTINAWNYFRRTEDIDWLKLKGYTMIKSNADFLLSKMTKKYSTAQAIYYYSLDDVIGINSNETTDNNFLSFYLARLAIKMTLEAAYFLNYKPSTTWTTFYNSYMQMPIYTDKKVCLNESELSAYITAGPNDSGLSNLNLLEPLVVMHPYYDYMLYNVQMKIYVSESVIFTLNGGVYNFSITDYNTNLTTYTSKIDSSYSTNIINLLMIAFGNFRYANNVSIASATEYLTTFEKKLALAINKNTSLPWNNFINIQQLGSTDSKLNDIGSSCAFLLCILCHMLGTTIRGQVSSNGSVVEPFGLNNFEGRGINLTNLSSQNYPSTWESIYLLLGGSKTIYTNVQ